MRTDEAEACASAASPGEGGRNLPGTGAGAEVRTAAAGGFFLTLSGGGVLRRIDLFEIVDHGRALLFDVKIKTNAFMIREPEADRILDLGVRAVQVSIYSHRP